MYVYPVGLSILYIPSVLHAHVVYVLYVLVEEETASGTDYLLMIWCSDDLTISVYLYETMVQTSIPMMQSVCCDVHAVCYAEGAKPSICSTRCALHLYTTSLHLHTVRHPET